MKVSGLTYGQAISLTNRLNKSGYDAKIDVGHVSIDGNNLPDEIDKVLKITEQIGVDILCEPDEVYYSDPLFTRAEATLPDLPEIKRHHPSDIQEDNLMMSDPVWVRDMFEGWLIGVYHHFLGRDSKTIHLIFMQKTGTQFVRDGFIQEWQPVEVMGDYMALYANYLVFKSVQKDSGWRNDLVMTEPLMVYGHGIAEVAVAVRSKWGSLTPHWLFSDWRINKRRITIDSGEITHWQKINKPNDKQEKK